MPIVIAIISIILITTIAWLLNKALPLRVCPICAGVSGTWALVLIGILTNQLSVVSYQLLVAILMGGSVVGIAYQLEKKLPPYRSALLWKTIFIPLGFGAVWGLLSFYWLALGGLVLAMIITAAVFLVQAKAKAQGDFRAEVEKIEEQMKNCC